MSTVDALRMRSVLGRHQWHAPEQFGPDGWMVVRHDRMASVIVSEAEFDGTTWIHASIAGATTMPTYDDLALLHRAVFGDRWAYQVFAPPGDHVNIHEHALHLWGRADGAAAMPNFGQFGTI